MKTGKVLLIGILLAVVFLFSPPDHQSILPPTEENTTNTANNFKPKNAANNK